MINSITITNLDEVSLRVESEDSGILQEIHEHFSFMAPGYKFMPSYRNKMWDGRIRLFNLRNRVLPLGLKPHLISLCQERKYHVTEIHGHKGKNCIDSVHYIESLKLALKGDPITLRDYQLTASRRALESERAVLVSPTGSGKSLIIYVLFRWFLSRPEAKGKKVIIIVPTTALVEQMYKDFEDYSAFDKDFEVKKDVHRIYSGKEKSSEARVYVTTWQSAITMPSMWFKQFGAVFGDEAHLFKAVSLTKIMACLTDAWFRIGTTGTLPDSKESLVHTLVLEGCFGPVFNVTTTQALIESDTLAQLKINILAMKYPEETRKARGKQSYAEEIDFLVSHPRRNNFIANLAIDQPGNTLVLFTLVEKHGKPLFELIRKKAGPNRQVFFVSGSVSAEDRERIRSLVETEKNAMIIASTGVFSIGVNIKNLHNIIIAAPTKSQVKLLQSIGRGLRKSDDGRPTTVFDLADDLTYKKNKNYTLKHGIDRLNIYKAEKFKFQVHEVPLS